MTTQELTASILLSIVMCVLVYVGFVLPTTQAEDVVSEEQIAPVTRVQYKTEWETYLYNDVQKTVDLPGFGDYQDLLASYAYNTCIVKLGDSNGKYSCENMLLTRNSENGGWRWNAENNSNSNGTTDGGLCQLNSQYHSSFIKSKWFNNPLSQLDYCLEVWNNAKSKGVMPRYGYNVRHERDKGIIFNHKKGKEKSITIESEPIYLMAKEAQSRADLLWKVCIDIGECNK